MTDQAEPGRPPAHSLSAFDLTKRSPEQLARSFARWKAQRKRPPEAAHASHPLPAQLSTAIEQDGAPDPSLGHDLPKPAPSKRAKPEYSATFSALLAAGSEPTVQRTAWTPIGERRSPKRSRSPGRRLKAMSILAGAASVLALAGGTLLELSDWRASTEAEPQVAQVQPQQIPMAGPIAAAATRAPSVEWKLQQIVDLALMKAGPDGGAAKPMQPTPEPPMVRTARKAAIAAPPVPPPKKTVPETEQFVAKPFVPSAALAPAVVPAAQGTAEIPAPPAVARSGDPRPDALFQHSRDKSIGTASNRVAPGAKPAAASGSESAVATTRTGTARSGTVAKGGNGDPRGEISGGASVGPGATSANEGDAGDASAGSDTGSGNTGDDGATDGGSASSEAGGSGTSGADTGAAADGDTSGGAAGDDAGDATGSGDPGDGASGEGDSGSGDGEEGDSGGIGGAISGALGGVGDALGGALGGGKNKSDSEDKDQKD